MPLDASVFEKLKTFADYQRAEDDFQMKKQLANAQLLTSQAQLAKAGEVDADKLGEQAFLKAAQGMQLSPQETAALTYIDAKSPTSAFNPVTGNMEVKPSLLDRAGVRPQGGLQPMQGGMRQAPRQSAPMSNDAAAQIVDLFGGDGQPVGNGPSEWDAAFQSEMDKARGNPKLQQVLKENYGKSKIGMTEAEAKSAGFADRMGQSNPIIDQTKVAAMDPLQNTLGAVPLVGNFMVSDDYQSAAQAQKDFLNSILRRESGAVVSPSEFANGKQQYFPVPGDSDLVLKQKAANRETATRSIRKAAGPSYSPMQLYDTSKAQFDSKKAPAPGIKFLGFE